MAAVLRSMGCRVWGIELDPGAASVASDVCEEVIVDDLERIDFSAYFSPQQFDVVLMLDILEHLRDPADLLRKLAPYVRPTGWGVISLPNVAHLSLRLALLEGQFRYRDAGLLDRTHLRFFDRRGVDRLLEEAGWSSFDVARVTRLLGTTEIVVEEADPELLAALEADPDALTYQFVVTAAPLGARALETPPLLPAAAAQRALVGASRRIAELEEEVAALRRVHVPDLAEQLEAIRGNSLTRRQHLKHLLAAVRSNSQLLADGEPG